jgi:hypothetical protein
LRPPIPAITRLPTRRAPPAPQWGEPTIGLAIRQHDEIIDDLADPMEALQLQIAHIVAQERRLRQVTRGAATLAEKYLLARELVCVASAGSSRPSLGAGEKVDHVLHLRHHRHLVGAVRQVGALAGGADMIVVERGGALFEPKGRLRPSSRAMGFCVRMRPTLELARLSGRPTGIHSA